MSEQNIPDELREVVATVFEWASRYGEHWDDIDAASQRKVMSMVSLALNGADHRALRPDMTRGQIIDALHGPATDIAEGASEVWRP